MRLRRSTCGATRRRMDSSARISFWRATRCASRSATRDVAMIRSGLSCVWSDRSVAVLGRTSVLTLLRLRRSARSSAVPAAATTTLAPGSLLLFGPRPAGTHEDRIIDDGVLQLQRLEERLQIRTVLPDVCGEVANL